MQKRLLPMLAAAFVAVILFSSCSKNNKQGRYIPSTAAMVVHIDGASLNEKLPWEEIKQNEMFKDALSDSSLSPLQKQILNDPANSGIDIKTDLEGFLLVNKDGGYVALEGTVKDAAKLKQMLAEAHKGGKETVKGDYTYYSEGSGIVAYNKERFFAAFDAPEAYRMMNGPKYSEMTTDSTFGTMPAPKTSDMNAVAESLINLKESESLAESKKFSDLLATKGDVHMWYNVEYLNTAGNYGGGIVNTDKFTKGLIWTGTLNFDNGRISFDMKNYAGKELTDLYEKYEGSDFDKSMVKNIPSQNLAGFFAINFKPEIIREMLKLLNVDGMANIALARMSITLDDIVKATKGDLMVAATDIPNDSVVNGKPKFIVSVSIGDKASFNKILNAYDKMGGGMSSDSSVNYKMNDKYFAFSDDKAYADAYLAGNAKSSFPALDKIPAGPMGGFIDFQYIFKSMQPSIGTDSIKKVMFNESVKLWDNAMMSGGNFKGGGLNQHFEVNMMDKNTNSLKQLNAYAAKMLALKKIEDKKREAMWMEESKSDPAIVVPAPAEK